MRTAATLALAIATSLAARPVEAGLWSSTNAVAPVGGTTTMSISFTGDQRTVAAQVDVNVPSGIRVLAVTGRNGGHCALQTGGRIVRVLAFDNDLLPLPSYAQPQCDMTIRVSGYALPWFSMTSDLCVDALSIGNRCAVDRGHLMITTP